MKTLEIEIPKGYEIDKLKSTFEKIVFKKKEEWIDLGLPSGNLWSNTSEEGYYTFCEAVTQFKDSLPTVVDFAELVHHCTWKWDSKQKGMVVTGPNKNYIILPAVGYRSLSGDSLICDGSNGYYWSASSTPISRNNAYSLDFHHTYITPAGDYNRGYGYSVRCVKRK